VLIVHDEKDVGAGEFAGLALQKGRSESGVESGTAADWGHSIEDIPEFHYNKNFGRFIECSCRAQSIFSS
jgi:hypothetical protein